eukprot:jgi/Tetstr1/426500/TSEL_016800.t1
MARSTSTSWAWLFVSLVVLSPCFLVAVSAVDKFELVWNELLDSRKALPSKRVPEGDADYDRKGKRPAQPPIVEAPSRSINAPEDGWLDKDGKIHRRLTADARILQRDLDDVFQIYDLLAPAEEPLRDLVEDGTDLPASSPASFAELFKTITAALALCTTVALRINKRGKKQHVEHEYGAEVAKEFDAVDPPGEKGSSDIKELKKATEKVKAKKPSSSSSRAKPSSSSRKPESFRRGSDNRREGGRREEKSPPAKRTLGLAVKNAKEPFAWSDIAKLVRLRCKDDSGICSWIVAVAAAVSFAGFCRYNDLRVLRWEDVSFLPTYLEFRFVKRKNDQHRLCGKSSRSGGASAAANADIPFATWGQHGGWKSTSAQLRYMGLDEEHVLSVSRAILSLAEEDELDDSDGDGSPSDTDSDPSRDAT